MSEVLGIRMKEGLRGGGLRLNLQCVCTLPCPRV